MTGILLLAFLPAAPSLKKRPCGVVYKDVVELTAAGKMVGEPSSLAFAKCLPHILDVLPSYFLASVFLVLLSVLATSDKVTSCPLH